MAHNTNIWYMQQRVKVNFCLNILYYFCIFNEMCGEFCLIICFYKYAGDPSTSDIIIS